MATDYLNVRGEILDMRQRKHELEEKLNKSDEELLRSVISVSDKHNDRHSQNNLSPSSVIHMQPDRIEVEKYLRLEDEKVR